MKIGMRFQKRLAVTMLLVVNMLAIAASLKAEAPKTIIISTDDHPPLLQSDKSSEKDQGIMTDIVRAAFQSQGIQVEYISVPAARIAWSLLEGISSATVGPLGWFRKSKSEDKVHCIEVYPASFHFYFMKKRFPNGLSYSRLEELKGLKIGYMYGGAATTVLEKAGLTIETVNDRDQNTRKLYMGRIDLLVTESVGGWASIKKLYPDKVDEFDMAENVIMEAPGCVIFMKDRLDLIRTFEQGFDEIRRDGTYLNIVNRYYAKQKIPQRVLDVIK